MPKKRPTIADCELIDLPIHADKTRGGMLIPFQTNRLRKKNLTIRQAYHIHSGNPYHPRGQHYHRTLQEVFIPVHGSVDVVVHDGKKKKIFHLDSKKPQALYIPAGGCWHELRNWKEGTTILGLASTFYRPNEFITKLPA